MGDKEHAGGSRQRVFRIVGVCSLVFLILVGLSALLYRLALTEVDEITWSARVIALSPSPGCRTLLMKGASEAIGTLVDIAGALLGAEAQEVDESPPDVEHAPSDADAGVEAREGDAGSVQSASLDVGVVEAPAPESPAEIDEPECDLEITAGVALDNPLPVGMDVKIERVSARVARSTIAPENVSFTDRAVWVPAGERSVLRIGLKMGSSQMMVAASGLMMTRKLRLKAQIVVEASALWGLIEQTRTVEVERALTIEEMIGGLDGSVGGE